MFRFLVVSLLSLCVSSVAFCKENQCPDSHCIAVIDAGSTGTRFHIYAYTLDATQTPINIKEIWLNRVKPGFATIDPTPEVIQKYMDALMAHAPVQNIPVHFYATAGMRLLPGARQKIYYNQLQNWFAQHANWQLIQAKTITGTEEAIFDWLSVNYHIDNLNAVDIKPVGVMDMGGASVQIVFPLDSGATTTKTLRPVHLKLYGRDIQLYAQSFLGLGQTEMSHQFLNSVPCFSEDYPLPDGEQAHGDALNCEHDISTLMNSVHGVNTHVGPVLFQNPIQEWYGIGGISNLADHELFHFNALELTNEELLSQADTEICHQSWDTLNSRFPNDDYLYQYCLLSSYYYALMVEGYGLDPEQKIKVISPKENLDWTKGVVLHQKL